MRLLPGIIVCCGLVLPAVASERPSLSTDSLPGRKTFFLWKGIRNFVESFDDIDTAWVEPNHYNYAFMIQNSNYGDSYRISNGKQAIQFAPNFTYRIGGYFGWRWIFVGYTWDVSRWFSGHHNIPKNDFQLSLYSSRLGCDLFYRQTGNNFRIKSTTNVFGEGTSSAQNLDFRGLDVRMKGLNLYYVFNYKRFSYPAAFSQSTNQRRSQGTFKLGFSYSNHDIRFDKNQLPSSILSRMDTARLYDRVKFHDYALTFGYAYNWVFARNWLACLSLDPAIGYKHSEIQAVKHNNFLHHFIRNINFDLITRAAVTWNNGHYFVGTSLVVNTYNYRKPAFSVTSNFGVLNIYFGFNFSLKKQYRKKR